MDAPRDDLTTPAATGTGRRRLRVARRLVVAPETKSTSRAERTLGKLIAQTALLADGVVQQRQRDRQIVHPARQRGGLFGFLR